ncbi:hypothetical protein ACHAWF_009055, partial [Thalassiosira exigua]
HDPFLRRRRRRRRGRQKILRTSGRDARGNSVGEDGRNFAPVRGVRLEQVRAPMDRSASATDSEPRPGLDDDGLDAPLMGGTAGDGVVTLHGEPIDASHFSGLGLGGGPRRTSAANASNDAAEAREGVARAAPAERPSRDGGGAGGSSAASESTAGEGAPEPDAPPDPLSLSVDLGSTATAAAKGAWDYARQTIAFLPKRTRAMYYRARYDVTTYIESKRSRIEGDGSTVEGAFVNDGAGDVGGSGDNDNRDVRGDSARGPLSQKSSLAFSPSAPLLLKLLLPPLLIANHVLFYRAQVAPMWNLTYKTNVTVSATAGTFKAKAAADALNLPHSKDFAHQEEKVVETFTYMDAIRKLWKGEGLGDARTISKVAAALLVVASGIWPHLKLLLVHLCWFFPFAHGLRDDRGDGEARRGCCSKPRGGRQRCGLCCSDGRNHRTHNSRSPFLRTLSTLGKWSLADVLVVCILIAVLHLDWKVDPDQIRKGVEDQLPTLLSYAEQKYPDEVADCAELLGYTCGRGAKVIHYPMCVACQTLIKNAYHHPEWTTDEGKDILEGIDLEGGGYAQLRVMGMVGTYYFCGAVLASILLGLVVDWIDERDRGRVEEDLVERRRELEFVMPYDDEGEGGHELQLQEETNDPSGPNGANDPSRRTNGANGTWSDERALYTRVLSNSSSRTPIPFPTTDCDLLKRTLHVVLSLASLPLACYAVALPTMRRLVFGGGPTLLHEVMGMVWERDYSIVTLVKTTGDAGGWDNFLMITFGIFAVFGPIARSCCLVLHASLGLPAAVLGECVERPRRRTALNLALYRLVSGLRGILLPAIDALGAFGCWEVLIVAMTMIQLEMPSITDTIYQDDRCAEADPEHGRTCVEVRFDTLDAFLVVGVAWAVLVAAGGLAMDLAARDAEMGPLNVDEEEKPYRFGDPIPRRRVNPRSSGLNRSGQGNAAVARGGEEEEDEYYSPLQQGGGGQDNGMEQIVFV